jgi:hypothetical protein
LRSVAGAAARDHLITKSIGAAGHNRPALLQGLGHSNNPALHDRLHDPALNNRNGLNNPALYDRLHNDLDHRLLHHLLHDRAVLDDLPFDYRRDYAPLGDATLYDLALNTRSFTLFLDHHAAVGVREIILVIFIDHTMRHAWAVEVILVVQGIAVSHLCLSRGGNDQSRPTE